VTLNPPFAPDTINANDMVNGSWGPSNGAGRSSISILDARADALAKAINATGVQALNPDVCGGGYFVLKGKEAEIPGIVHGGLFGMVTHDSRSGTSVGYLAEVGHGPFSVGHESSVNIHSGEVESSNLFLAGLGDHLGGFAGYNDHNSPIQVGGYASAFGRGGGAYLNLVPGGGRHK
jgi:hypothetical protein